MKMPSGEYFMRNLVSYGARYRLLIKYSPDGIFILDLNTSKILEVNDQLFRNVGIREQDVAQLTLKDILVLKDRAIRTNIQEMLERGQASEYANTDAPTVPS